MWPVQRENRIVCELSILLAIVFLYTATTLGRTTRRQDDFAPDEARAGYDLDDASPYADNSSDADDDQVKTVDSGRVKYYIIWSKKNSTNLTSDYVMDFTLKKRSLTDPQVSICGYNGQDPIREGEKPSPYMSRDPWGGPRLRSNGSERIYQGWEAPLEIFPWMAMVRVFLKPSNNLLRACTGTIVSEWLILTAAHCLRDCSLPEYGHYKYGEWIDPKWLGAHIGHAYYNYFDIQFWRSNTEFNAILLPERGINACRDRGLDHALLVSRKKLDLNQIGKDKPRAVCLPKVGDKHDIPSYKRKYYAAGWGPKNNESYFSNELRYGEQFIMDSTGPGCTHLRKGFLCATGVNSPCFEHRVGVDQGGDAGAPLMRKVRRQFRLDDNRLIDLDVVVQEAVMSQDRFNTTKCLPNAVRYYSKLNYDFADIVEAFNDEPKDFRNPFRLKQAKWKWEKQMGPPGPPRN